METLALPASLDTLAQFSLFIEQAARRCGLDERAIREAQLAVDEAITNIIQYAYAGIAQGLVTVSAGCVDAAFVVSIHDTGRPFEPASVPVPDLTSSIEEREAGGLGLYLMRRLMDSVEFSFDAKTGNVLTMVKQRSQQLPPEVRILALGGRIDAANAPVMAQQVRAAMAEGATRIILDFALVSFLSSSGLRMLRILDRELKQLAGALRLCALPPHIAEVFSLTGFNQLFQIDRSREEAVAAILA